MASVRGTPFRRVAELFGDYIHKQRDRVRTMLQVAGSLAESNPPSK